MIHTISITQNKRMFYNYLMKIEYLFADTGGCTINELLSLSQRFEVAKMLMDKRTYLDISEKTGASTATISRVNRSLNYGNDGYEMVFSRMAEKETKGE